MESSSWEFIVRRQVLVNLERKCFRKNGMSVACSKAKLYLTRHALPTSPPPTRVRSGPAGAQPGKRHPSTNASLGPRRKLLMTLQRHWSMRIPWKQGKRTGHVKLIWTVRTLDTYNLAKAIIPRFETGNRGHGNMGLFEKVLSLYLLEGPLTLSSW